MQGVKTKEARQAWLEEARRLVREARDRGEEDTPQPPPSPPYAADPDWSLATCGLGEAVERARVSRVGEEEQIARAVVVLGEQLEEEGGEAVRWAGRPGQEGEGRRDRRIGRIQRLEEKLGRLRRSLSERSKV